MKDTILLSTLLVVKRETKRVLAETGVEVADWLMDCADIAEDEWYDPDNDRYDVDAINSQIYNDAESFIDFHKKNYREEW